MVVDERIADEFYVVEIGEEIEEWIGGTGDQNLVAGIAKQAKKVRVCFAGAGSEEKIVGRG